MSRPPSSGLWPPFQTQLERLATTRRPSTMCIYGCAARRLVRFLAQAFPQLQCLSELRRDPHLLAYLGWLCRQTPPLSKKARYNDLVCLRRLLEELALSAPAPPPAALLVWTDMPRLDRYLPRPLSLDDDRLLNAYWRPRDDLASLALRLIRATGIRIGECLDLSLHALRHLLPGQWAIQVPLGKLHTERCVPVDPDTRLVFQRLLERRRELPSASGSPYLLPRPRPRASWGNLLRRALRQAARAAGCSRDHFTPHQLRHTFATEMVRAGVALPALMRLLGHTDVRMTLRYVELTQADLQREFLNARQKLAAILPAPPLPPAVTAVGASLSAVRASLQATRRILEACRRDTHDPDLRGTLDRLANRLSKVSIELDQRTAPA